MNKAIALISGGLDSCAAAWLARESEWQIETVLTYDYGQRAAQREIQAANRFAEHLGAAHLVLSLPFFSEYRHGNGLLAKDQALPSPSLAQLDERQFSEQSAASVWVPNRNGILIEIAAGIAEDRGCQGVIVGFNSEEAATFPDNSQDYLTAINGALGFSTSGSVRVVSPTIGMQKTQIARELRKSGFPFSLLWSCYENGEHMCGRCESCMRLKRALKNNEVTLDRIFDDISL